MKVIFLDHDGVICLPEEWGSRTRKQKAWSNKKVTSLRDIPIKYRFDDFNKKAVEILNEILTETGAEIVVSSDWRLYSTLSELKEFYKEQGVIKEPIAMTGFTTEFASPENRQQEILNWLGKRSAEEPIESWVCLDDMDMQEFLSPNNFIWLEDDTQGITKKGFKEKIISLLN